VQVGQDLLAEHGECRDPPSATSEARRAATTRCLCVTDAVSPRKMGTAPGGFMITSNVTNTERKSCTSK